MGRPLKKSLFGSDANNNLKVQFNNGSASVPGFIVKQKGAKKFLCQDKNGNQAVCVLVAKAANALAAGEMSITVRLDSNAAVQVTKISSHNITAGGVSYPWTFTASLSDGAAQVEEAGTTSGANVLVGATNIEGDSE